MNGRFPRRQILGAAGGIGLAVSGAGCLSGGSDGADAADGGDESSGTDVDERTPCDVSRDLLRHLIAGETDEALEYVPYEHDDELERADARSYLSDWESTDPGAIELVEHSCETLELDEEEGERADLLDMFDATSVFGRTHEVEVDGDNGSLVREAEVVVFEIDGAFYAIAAGPGTAPAEFEVTVEIEGELTVPADAQPTPERRVVAE